MSHLKITGLDLIVSIHRSVYYNAVRTRWVRSCIHLLQSYLFQIIDHAKSEIFSQLNIAQIFLIFFEKLYYTIHKVNRSFPANSMRIVYASELITLT